MSYKQKEVASVPDVQSSLPLSLDPIGSLAFLFLRGERRVHFPFLFSQFCLLLSVPARIFEQRSAQCREPGDQPVTSKQIKLDWNCMRHLGFGFRGATNPAARFPNLLRKVSDGTEDEERRSSAIKRLKRSPWRKISWVLMKNPNSLLNEWRFNCKQIFFAGHILYFCGGIIETEKPWERKLEHEQMPVGGFMNKKMRSVIRSKAANSQSPLKKTT